MEIRTLRRSQSLKSLSVPHEQSWYMFERTFRDRKSVSQLVQQYQSFGDLRITERADNKLKPSVVSSRVEVLESRADGHRNDADHFGYGGSFRLSRSRSMDYLPQRESVGTNALRALFESKSSESRGFVSSPRLNAASPAGRKTEKHCHPEAKKGHSITNPISKDLSTQRITQVERRKTMSGPPESYTRGLIFSDDDRRTPQSTLRDNLSRQSRDRTSPRALVKDRSALYLSRVAATDCTGSTHPESRKSSEQKTKVSKFQPLVREMCSACLTPVYPMEKMVANELILHTKCFTCKHCEKKLSIHNYSSLYGEFYCIFHYQQLFKRKGNYDEGFGHKQHKDLWLQKHKGTDVPDDKRGLQTDGGYSPTINGSGESPAGGLMPKSVLRETTRKSGPDIRSRLKISWPPEKKNGRGSSAQLANVRTQRSTVPDKDKAAKTVIRPFSDRHADVNKSDISKSSGRTLEREKTLFSSSVSRGKEKSPNFNLAEKFTSNKPKPGTVSAKWAPFQYSASTTEVGFSSPHSGKGTTVISTKQNTEHIHFIQPATTNHNSTPDWDAASPNKVKKSVRFASNVDDQLSPELSSVSENKDQGQQKSEQSEGSTHTDNMYKGEKDNSTKMEAESLSFELKNKQVENEVASKTHKHESNGKTTSLDDIEVIVSESSASEPVNTEMGQANPQTANEHNNKPLNGDFKSCDRNRFEVIEENGNLNLDKNVLPHQRMSEKHNVVGITLNDVESAAQDIMESQAEYRTIEKKPPANTENLVNKNSMGEQGTFLGQNGSQSNGVERSNSPKGSAGQPNDRSNIKKGSLSKGKSPFSKLFTSGIEEKTNKEGPDKKKPDAKPRGILGKLFQSSEKRSEESKPATKEEKKEHKPMEETKEKAEKEVTKIEDESRPTPLEQDVGGKEILGPLLIEPDPLDSFAFESKTTKPSSPLKSPVSDVTGVLAIEQPTPTAPQEIFDDDNVNPFATPERILQSSAIQGQSGSNASIVASDHIDSCVSAESSMPKSLEIATSGNISEKSSDNTVHDATQEISDSFFGETSVSASVEPLTTHADTCNTVHQPNKMPETPGLGESKVGERVLFNLSDEITEDTLNSHSPLKPHGDISDNASGAAVSVVSLSNDVLSTDTANAFLEVQETLGFGSEVSVPNKEILKQDEQQTFDPFDISAMTQTKEQEISFDIFSTQDTIAVQLPANHVLDLDGFAGFSDSESVVVSDDIFAVTDISTTGNEFAVQPSQATPTICNDILGLDDAPITTAISNNDLILDIFATEVELTANAASTDKNSQSDTLLEAFSGDTEHEIGKNKNSNSWMDDLLG